MSEETPEIKQRRNVEKSTKLVVWCLKFLGCLPDFRRSSSRLQKIIAVYSCLILIANIYFTSLFFSTEPMNNYNEKLAISKFELERHEKTLMAAATVMNFSFGLTIQILYFLYSRRIHIHLEKWIDLEKFYFEKVKEDLMELLRNRTIKWLILLNIYNVLLTMLQFNPRFNFQIRPETSFFFFCLLRYTDVLFLTIMYAASSAAKTISERYVTKVMSGEHSDLLWLEGVWLRLAELIRDSGESMAPILFIHMMRYAVLGLFFSYMICVRFMVLLDKTEFIIIVVWSLEFGTIYYFIWRITSSAYEAQNKVSQLAETLRHLINEHEKTIDKATTEQVISFQDTIVALPPKIELLDYMVVDKKLFVSINQLYLTYLIILVQFKIAEYNIKERLIIQLPTAASLTETPYINAESTTPTTFLTTLTNTLNLTPALSNEVQKP